MTNGITYVISFLISFVLYSYELSLFKTDMTKPALLRCYKCNVMNFSVFNFTSNRNSYQRITNEE